MLKELKFNVKRETERIKRFISGKMRELNRDGAIISLSGGLDSAVVAKLTIDAMGSNLVKLFYLPERDSKKIHKEHAEIFAKQFGNRLQKKSITNILFFLGSYKILPLIYIPTRSLRHKAVEYGRNNYLDRDEKDFIVNRFRPKPNSWIARGTAYAMSKHRIRMVKIYMEAEIGNLMVVGAANRTELLTGTFSKWGIDHCADIMPIIHLYRSQVEKLAEYIKIPDYIRTKPADPDILPSLNNKEDLLGSFDLADEILYQIEKGVRKEELIKKYNPETVNRLYLLWNYSKHMREAPYHL